MLATRSEKERLEAAADLANRIEGRAVGYRAATLAEEYGMRYLAAQVRKVANSIHILLIDLKSCKYYGETGG